MERILLLTTPRSYRSESFIAAAKRLGIKLVIGLDMPANFPDKNSPALHLDFAHVNEAVETIKRFAAASPISAILPVDDSGGALAARASAALGLPYNDEQAAHAARDKGKMRQMLRQGGALCPAYLEAPFTADPAQIGEEIQYPCVVKPLQLSGSRGVIRADNPTQFAPAFILAKKIAKEQSPQAPPNLLVEEFVPGIEVAVEGLIYQGELKILAIFDKPDPLDGPYFEETIYVTPSRLPPETQQLVAAATTTATRALGLRRGPIHAELRINERGAYLIEIAGRSIGGLCSQILQFGAAETLEELILKEAAGREIDSFKREPAARGVMMIPIPKAGLLREIAGIAEAEATPLVHQVKITAPLHNPLTPLPAGDSYLGFIFAKGGADDTPHQVEKALRTAHACLQFRIDPIFELTLA